MTEEQTCAWCGHADPADLEMCSCGNHYRCVGGPGTPACEERRKAREAKTRGKPRRKGKRR
ncbi:MAG TPA: hypothetical protein VGK41_08275 [Solirubrobacterales bacterium]